MPVKVVCPSCGRSGRVPETALGREIACPACQGRFRLTVPAPMAADPAVPPTWSHAFEPPIVIPPPAPGLPRWVYAALAGGGGTMALLLGLVVALLARPAHVEPAAPVPAPLSAPPGFAEAARPGGPVARTATAPPRPEVGTELAHDPETPPPPPVPDIEEPEGPPLSTAEIVARCEPSVALIKGRMSSGTGFLVRPGVVATNAHVIDDEMIAGLEVRFPSAPTGKTEPLPAELLYEDARRDLAFLAVETDLPPLEIARQLHYRKGEDVTIIGNPGVGGELVLENAVSRGVLSVRTKIDGQDFVQLGIAINPGNSGGPVFDSHGRVIGVATLKTKEQEALAFCIPVEDLRAALDRLARQAPRAALDAASKHRLPVVFKRLTEAGAVHAVGLDLRLAAWERAPRGPLDLNGPAHTDLRAKLADLAKIDTLIFAPVPAEARRIADDPRSPEAVRRDIGRLADNYAELKRLADHPGNSLATFRREVAERKQAHRRLVAATAAMLKLDVPPILVQALSDHDLNDPVALLERSSPLASRPGLPSFRDRFGLGPRLGPGPGPPPFPRVGPPSRPGFGPSFPRHQLPRSRSGRR